MTWNEENNLKNHRDLLLKAAWRLEANNFYGSDSAKALCCDIRELVGSADMHREQKQMPNKGTCDLESIPHIAGTKHGSVNGAPMHCENWKPLTHSCYVCGESADQQHCYLDSCPTDRGTEVREVHDWICEDCAAAQLLMKSLLQ